MRYCGGLSMVLLQPKDPLQLFVKNTKSLILVAILYSPIFHIKMNHLPTRKKSIKKLLLNYDYLKQSPSFIKIVYLKNWIHMVLRKLFISTESRYHKLVCVKFPSHWQILYLVHERLFWKENGAQHAEKMII